MKLFNTPITSLGPVHFIGIGGIGMVGLVEILARLGCVVQGSDLSAGYAERLRDELGVVVHEGHAAKNVGDAKLVVVSTAIKKDNPELLEAEKRGIKIIHRADLLAEIMQHYQTIVVAGTHGKTSTTAMIFTALREAGANVGVIDGGILNDIGAPVVLPPKAGDWLVVEADESDASFLKLPVQIAVVTNIEPEHMDTYDGQEAKLVAAFGQFMGKAEIAVVCGDDANALAAASMADIETVTYGMGEGAVEEFDVATDMYIPQGRGMAFDAIVRGGRLDDVVVAMPGAHFVNNALAVLAVGSILRFDLNKITEGLARFKGVGRRFSCIGRLFGDANGPEVIDDYGHHPTEIKATLSAAKHVYGKGKVVAVIEPHRYTRVRDLMDEFATCAAVADTVLVLPIYAASEAPIAGISSDVLAEKMGAETVTEEGLAAKLTSLNLGPNDGVIVLGAGKSSKLAKGLGK